MATSHVSVAAGASPVLILISDSLAGISESAPTGTPSAAKSNADGVPAAARETQVNSKSNEGYHLSIPLINMLIVVLAASVVV
jgi:hypothetical protein